MGKACFQYEAGSACAVQLQCLHQFVLSAVDLAVYRLASITYNLVLLSFYSILYAVNLFCFCKVDVEEFYQLFFSDEAIGFVKNFHTKCGDQGNPFFGVSIQCNYWSHCYWIG